jgi:hypothetical protein
MSGNTSTRIGQYIAQRSKSLKVLGAVLLGIAAAFGSILKDYDVTNNPIPALVLGGIMIATVVSVMIGYLREPDPTKELSRDSTRTPHSLSHTDLATLPDFFLSDIKTKRAALEFLTTTIPADTAIRLTENFVSDALTVSRMREQSEALVNRLTTEISALSRRANTALIIGTITSILGVSLLGIFALSAPLTYSDWINLAAYYLPRLSVVIFLQVFAYFFLRLYRYGIYEIKYFQNEITNIQARALALQTALLLRNDDIIKVACRSLVATERNFIIRKGERTLPILQEEIGALGDRMPLDFVEKVVNRVVGVLRRDKPRDAETSRDTSDA